MKLLITGGAGYIGSHSVNELVKQGHQLVVIDDLSTGFVESIDITRVQFYKVNILDKLALEAIFRNHVFDGIIHFAAKIVVADSVKNPLFYYENNFVGTLNLLNLCDQYKVNKFVFSSTAAVYGQLDKSLVSEDDLVRPINPYGESKYAVEKMLKYFSESRPEFKYVALRYFNVAGADIAANNGQRTKNATHLVKVACEAALGLRESVQILGTDYPTVDGTGVRDYIHVMDLVDAHCLAISYLAQNNKSEVINCAYGRGFSVLQVIESVKKVSGVNFKTIYSDRRLGDPAMVVANNEKILRLFNWRPKFESIDVICKSSYDWEKLK